MMSRRSYIKLSSALIDDRILATLSDKDWRAYVEAMANDTDRIHWEEDPVRKEWNQIKEQRSQELARRDKQQCRHCGTKDNLEIDHVKPLAVGGSFELSNLQYLCRRCNSKKGARFIG